MHPGRVKKQLTAAIKAARKRKTWSQEEMSVRSGIPLSTYKKLERQGEGSFDNFLRIVGLLGDVEALKAVFPEPKYSSLDDVDA
ncbi:MAG: helix-turn-helix domain-containing protein [Opitutales bacterium]